MRNNFQNFYYYDILGLNRNSSLRDLKIMYRNLAKKYHPDRIKDDGFIMKFINEAYDVVVNPQKREEYNTWLETKPWKTSKINFSRYQRALMLVSVNRMEQININQLYYAKNIDHFNLLVNRYHQLYERVETINTLNKLKGRLTSQNKRAMCK